MQDYSFKKNSFKKLNAGLVYPGLLGVLVSPRNIYPTIRSTMMG